MKKTADLVTFTEEIRNGKRHFLRSVSFLKSSCFSRMFSSRCHRSENLTNFAFLHRFNTSFFDWMFQSSFTTSFNKAWTQILRRFKSCLRRVGDSRWWGSLTMFPAWNTAKRLSSVNRSTKSVLKFIKQSCQASL